MFSFFAMMLLAGAPVPPNKQCRVFGTGSKVLLLQLPEEKVTPLELPEGLTTIEAACSPNGEFLAFTGKPPGYSATQLFLYDRSSQQVSTIGEQFGYHAEPWFSESGEWIYFAHNTISAGEPLNHREMAYAQIYKVKPDGSSLQALTNERGCHFSPREARGTLFYLHSSCKSQDRFIESPGKTQWLQVQDRTNIFDISQDGQTVIWGAPVGQEIHVYSLSSNQKGPSLLLKLENSRAKQVAISGKSVFFEQDGALWKFDGTHKTQFAGRSNP